MVDVDGKLEQWKRELIDPSKKNTLLNFKPTKRGDIEIVKPDMDKLFEMMVIEQKTTQTEWSYPSKLDCQH